MNDPAAEDLEQVHRLRGGDPRGFEVLFDKYREKVYRIAYRFVRDKEDALEVTQEVFLRVYQKIGDFQTESKFFTWLYRIAVNRAIDFTRSRKARPAARLEQSFLEEQEFSAAGKRSRESPVERAERRELEEALAQAIDELSDKHRAVFVLHARENLSYKEIAEVVDCSVGTVMSRLFYARKNIQDSLRRRGFEAPRRAAED